MKKISAWFGALAFSILLTTGVVSQAFAYGDEPYEPNVPYATLYVQGTPNSEGISCIPDGSTPLLFWGLSSAMLLEAGSYDPYFASPMPAKLMQNWKWYLDGSSTPLVDQTTVSMTDNVLTLPNGYSTQLFLPDNWMDIRHLSFGYHTWRVEASYTLMTDPTATWDPTSHLVRTYYGNGGTIFCTPEPASMALFLIGGLPLGLAAIRRKINL